MGFEAVEERKWGSCMPALATIFDFWLKFCCTCTQDELMRVQPYPEEACPSLISSLSDRQFWMQNVVSKHEEGENEEGDE